MHLDDFPKLQPPTGARMPNKANLKRSLLPENSPLVLQPDLNISHPDKQGLKRIPHASPRTAKIPRIPTMPTRTWHRWTAGLAAALLGTLIWFAGPSPDPMSPGHPPSPEPNPATNAEVHRNTLQTATPEHPEADASLAGIPTPSEKNNINAIAKSSADTRIETHASDASTLKRPNLLAQLPVRPASQVQNMAPRLALASPAIQARQNPLPDENWAIANEKRTSTSEVSGAQTVWAFLEDQPVGAAVRGVKFAAQRIDKLLKSFPESEQMINQRARQTTSDWRNAFRNAGDKIERQWQNQRGRAPDFLAQFSTRFGLNLNDGKP